MTRQTYERPTYERPEFPLMSRYLPDETAPDSELHFVRRLDFVQDVNELQRRLLVPPNGDVRVPPFLWIDSRTGKPPASFRWMWQPETGEMLLDWGGNSAGNSAHALMLRQHLGPGSPRQFDKWLRGYFVPSTGIIGTRPYYNADLVGKEWGDWGDEEAGLDDGHLTARRLNDEVQSAAEALFRQVLGPYVPGLKFVGNIDNQWAREVGLGG